MPRIETLRVFVQQRLSLAAEEIFELFERTIEEYEETLCQQGKVLDSVFKPQVCLQRTGVHLLSVSEEEVSAEQHHAAAEPPHVKAEQEELWTNPEGDQLQGPEEADVTEITFSHVRTKSEEMIEQLHHTKEMKTEGDGDVCGGPEPDRNLIADGHLQPDTYDEMFQPFELNTDDSCEWKETGGAQSALNPQRNHEEPECETLKTKVSSPECSENCGCKKYLHGIQKGVKTLSCFISCTNPKRRDSSRVHARRRSEGKEFNGSVCQTLFPLRGDYATHVRIHSREKPFGCFLCGTGFAQKRHLTQHMRVHTGEKPFTCSVCGKGFALSGNLTTHERTHTGERPYSCSVCEKSFTRFAYLKQHKCAGKKSGLCCEDSQFFQQD